jgi:hypothetical protein
MEPEDDTPASSLPDDRFEFHCVPLEGAWSAIEACIEGAKREPELCSIFMETDNGGVRLLHCPMTLVNASPRSLVQLLADIEAIEGPYGFRKRESTPSDESGMCWNRVPKGHPGVTELVLHQKVFEEIRPEILAVLSGTQPRLDLPEWWPNDPSAITRPADTLEEARAHGTGAVICVGFRRYANVFEAPVSIVRVPLERIETLMTEVLRSRPHPDPEHVFHYPLEPEVRIWLHPVQCQHPQDYVQISHRWNWLRDEETCQRIRGVLMGERERF